MQGGAILYNNLLRSATIGTEDTVTNYPASNMFDGRTATQAGFATGATRTVYFSFASDVTIQAMAIARHNLGSCGGIVQLQYSNDNWVSHFQTVGTMNPTTDANKHVLFVGDKTAQYWRINVYSHTTTAYIGDFFFGPRLDLERSQKHGFTPPELADGDKIIPNVTRGQNLAGLTVEQGVKNVKFELPYYSESFFDEWDALRTTMKQYPIYVVWWQLATPFYCWPKKNIPEPSYSKNINDFYSVTLDMEGFTE